MKERGMERREGRERMEGRVGRGEGKDRRKRGERRDGERTDEECYTTEREQNRRYICKLQSTRQNQHIPHMLTPYLRYT